MFFKKYQVTHNGNKFDYVLLALVIALVIMGSFIVFSASAYAAALEHKSSIFFLKKQLTFSFLGLLGMAAAMKIDFYQLRRFSRTMMLVVSFLLLCTYFSFTGGTVVNGANGWIVIPILNQGFQPSEMAKIVAIIYSANILSNEAYYRKNIFDKLLTVIPLIGMLGIVVLQPDMGNTSIISMAVLSVYFAGGLSKKLITSAIIGLGGMASILIFSNPYQLDRVTFFMNPWQDPQGKGFQLIQSLLAIGSGGVTGRGLGQSIQKLFYLPESHTDFIFAIFCEETGLVGGLIMVFLIFVFLTRGLNIAVKNKDPFIKLVSVGITVLICGQAFMNMGVATGILPTTGITLPFISYGGTSILITLFCVGLLLNASSYTYSDWSVIENKKEENN